MLQDLSGVIFGPCIKLARKFAIYGKHGRPVDGFPMKTAADARIAIQTATASAIRKRVSEPLAVARKLGHRAMCIAVIDGPSPAYKQAEVQARQAPLVDIPGRLAINRARLERLNKPDSKIGYLCGRIKRDAERIARPDYGAYATLPESAVGPGQYAFEERSLTLKATDEADLGLVRVRWRIVAENAGARIVFVLVGNDGDLFIGHGWDVDWIIGRRRRQRAMSDYELYNCSVLRASTFGVVLQQRDIRAAWAIMRDCDGLRNGLHGFGSKQLLKIQKHNPAALVRSSRGRPTG